MRRGAPEGPGKPLRAGRGGARFVPGPRRSAAAPQSWLESLLCSGGLRAVSPWPPAALGDTIATAWESHKPRAGGEAAGGKQERATKQGEGWRTQKRGGRWGPGSGWDEAKKNRE